MSLYKCVCIYKYIYIYIHASLHAFDADSFVGPGSFKLMDMDPPLQLPGTFEHIHTASFWLLGCS